MSQEKPVIAVDMLGTDEGREYGDIECKAIRKLLKGNQLPKDVRLILVGNRSQILDALEGVQPHENILEIIHAPERVDSETAITDTRALKQELKKKTSTEVCHNLVRAEKKADAVVSAGHTGFQGYLVTRKVNNESGRIMVPNGNNMLRFDVALGLTLPNPNAENDFSVFADVGARNFIWDAFHDTRMLINNALLGTVFWRLEAERLGIAREGLPTAKLVSNGTEVSKAIPPVKNAHNHLKLLSDINYQGLIESNAFFEEDINRKADVFVADGDRGNLVIKAMGGLGKGMKKKLVSDGKRLIYPAIGGLLAKGSLQAFSPDDHSGAVFLGVDSVAVKVHGSSSPDAVISGIKRAISYVMHDLVGTTKSTVLDMSPEFRRLLAA